MIDYEKLSKEFTEKLQSFKKDDLGAWLNMDQEINKYRLFLDDIRMPSDVFKYTMDIRYATFEWIIVRNYDEFTTFIKNNGLPELISFDHDLADSHYTPKEYWTDYDKSKEWQDAHVHTEKTGYECAKWLVEYCMDRNLKLPTYICHSMNPVGKDNILGILKNFEKTQ